MQPIITWILGLEPLATLALLVTLAAWGVVIRLYKDNKKLQDTNLAETTTLSKEKDILHEKITNAHIEYLEVVRGLSGVLIIIQNSLETVKTQTAFTSKQTKESLQESIKTLELHLEKEVTRVIEEIKRTNK